MSPANVNPYAAPGADLDAGPATDNQRMAERGTRLGATLIDGLIVGALPVILMLVGGGLSAASGAGGNAGMGVGMLVAFAWLAALGIYQLWSLGTRGQTLGKRWMGIKIVKLDGAPVTFGTAVILRALVPGLLGVVPGFGLIDVLFIFRDDRRCLHDLIASTKVVVAE
jgi:uncharacterized RDD family membrane protein YckC